MARVHLQMGQSGGGAYVRSRLGEALIESVLCEAGRCVICGSGVSRVMAAAMSFDLEAAEPAHQARCSHDVITQCSLVRDHHAGAGQVTARLRPVRV